jgi:Zn-finger nucleic acid-binding protein
MTQCPSCNTPLRLVVERNVNIDVCDNCHGVWLDPGELAQLIDSNDFTASGSTVSGRSDLKCPRCSTQEFSTIRADIGSIARCDKCCGVFVEGETLDGITKTDPSQWPRKQTAKRIAMSTEALNGLIELLWFFGHL